MITGFNTDVEHAGRKFHVQTQEQGPSNPVVETLVYAGGAIVTFVTNSYADIVERAGRSPQEILARMEDQHELLIRQILSGKFDPRPKPYGHDIISGHSLDEVVRDFLDDSGQLLADARRQLDDEVTTGQPSARVKADRLRRVLARLERRIEDSVAGGAAERPGEQETAGVDGTAIPSTDPQRRAEARAEAVRRRQRRKTRWALLAAAGAILAVVLLSINIERNPAPPVLPPIAATPAPAPGIEPERTSPQTAFELPTVEVAVKKAGVEARRGADATSAPAPVTNPGQAIPPLDRHAPAARSEPAREPSPPRPVRAKPVRTTSPRTASPEPAREQPVEAPVVDARKAPASEAPLGPPDPTAGSELPPDRAPTATPALPEPPPAASRPARRGELVDYAEVDVEPLPVRRDLPRYTRKARKQGRQGVVEMALLIIENGHVAATELVEQIPGSDLSDAALEAARGWQFSPARKDGVPVRVWKHVRVHFSIVRDGTASVRIDE